MMFLFVHQKSMNLVSKTLLLSTSLRLFAPKADQSAASFKSLLEAKDALQIVKTNGKVKFIDGTWYLGDKERGYFEYLKARVPGATFFDLDKIADTTTNLPHMLPNESLFSITMSSFGVDNNDHVIVYSQSDTFSASRVWWTFKTFGHDKVSILQGGLNSWIESGGQIESGANTNQPPASNYVAKLNPKLVVNSQQVLDVVMTGTKQIIDARPKDRFEGKAPEPRPGLAGGHIPGSLNLPVGSVVEAGQLSKFKDPAAIRDAFRDAGLILGSDVILTCGSGVTASVLYFALHQLGYDLQQMAVYDGSWSEWGRNKDLPIYNPTLDESNDNGREKGGL